MPHKFLRCNNFNGNADFQTHSVILDHTPYKPKVLVIGTYNEGGIIDNIADFFYGRNYFWPVISNLYVGANLLEQRRDAMGPIPPGNPTLGTILDLCARFRLTFADLVADVPIPPPNHNDNYINAAVGQGIAITNELQIVDYINRVTSITHVYATTKFTKQPHLSNLWQQISVGVNRPEIFFGKILTPSGMGGIPNFPELERAATIARYWLWVNHPMNPYGAFRNQMGYSYLDHNWLIQSGVNPNLF